MMEYADQEYEVHIPSAVWREMHVYESLSMQHVNAKDIFSVAFPRKLLDGVLLHDVIGDIHAIEAPKGPGLVVRAHSKLRPAVVPHGRAGFTDQLVHRLAQLDACNLSRDALFEDLNVTVVFRVLTGTRNDMVSFTTLILIRVEVEP